MPNVPATVITLYGGTDDEAAYLYVYGEQVTWWAYKGARDAIQATADRINAAAPKESAARACSSVGSATATDAIAPAADHTVAVLCAHCGQPIDRCGQPLYTTLGYAEQTRICANCRQPVTAQPPAATPRKIAEDIVDAYLAKCDKVNPDGSTCEDIERDLIEPIQRAIDAAQLLVESKAATAEDMRKKLHASNAQLARLTGMKFSARMHAALVSRAEKAESALKAAKDLHLRASENSHMHYRNSVQWKGRSEQAEGQLASIRSETIEECAKVCQAMPDSVPGPLNVTNGPYDCAVALRALQEPK